MTIDKGQKIYLSPEPGACASMLTQVGWLNQWPAATPLHYISDNTSILGKMQYPQSLKFGRKLVAISLKIS